MHEKSITFTSVSRLSLLKSTTFLQNLFCCTFLYWYSHPFSLSLRQTFLLGQHLSKHPVTDGAVHPDASEQLMQHWEHCGAPSFPHNPHSTFWHFPCLCEDECYVNCKLSLNFTYKAVLTRKKSLDFQWECYSLVFSSKQGHR